jgi:hypothetical protein
MSEEMHIYGVVTHDKQSGPIENAVVCLDDENQTLERVHTDENGGFRFRLPSALPPRAYYVRCKAFGADDDDDASVEIPASESDRRAEPEKLIIDLTLGLEIQFKLHPQEAGGVAAPASYAVVGQVLLATVASTSTRVKSHIRQYRWPGVRTARVIPIEEKDAENEAVVTFLEAGEQIFIATVIDDDGAKASVSRKFPVAESVRTVRLGGRLEGDGPDFAGRVKVTMGRPDSFPTEDEVLWKAIHERSELIGFRRYQDYIQRVLKLDEDGFLSGGLSRRLGELGARGLGVYRTLRDFTELFVLSECGSISHERVFQDERMERELRPERQSSREIEEQLRDYLRDGELPYIERVVKTAYPSLDPRFVGLDALRSRVFRHPLFLELWHEMSLEHGMLMRTMAAISARFQNTYISGENDGLSNYESSPLRPLSDFFWGWIDNEPMRLNAKRRIQEYRHQYGPSALDGAVAGIQAADVRTAFPDAFMNLMSLCEAFYKEDNQTTVIADAFPVLFGLRQLHQILAMGAGNTAPQLTFTARVETLMMQLMLAQPELRAFLRVREMVPYDEAWQASVDAMIDLQGWQQPSTTQHNDCARFGEQILLSIRLADWTAGDETNARNWLRHHREAIRRFMYAQRAISAVDFAGAGGWRPPRPAFTPAESRPAISGTRQRAFPELGSGAHHEQAFAQEPGQFAPRLPSRGWPAG